MSNYIKNELRVREPKPSSKVMNALDIGFTLFVCIVIMVLKAMLLDNASGDTAYKWLSGIIIVLVLKIAILNGFGIFNKKTLLFWIISTSYLIIFIVQVVGLLNKFGLI